MSYSKCRIPTKENNLKKPEKNNTLPTEEQEQNYSQLLVRNDTRRERNEILEMLKEKDDQPRIPYPAKVPFKSEVKTSDKQNQGNLSLSSMPCKGQEFLQAEGK